MYLKYGLEGGVVVQDTNLWQRVNENNPCSHLSFDIVPLNSVNEPTFA